MELIFLHVWRPKIRQIIVYCLALLLYSSVLLLFLLDTSSNSYTDIHNPMGVANKGIATIPLQQKNSNESNIEMKMVKDLSGPGSSPPRCISKCAKCTPCKAVRVPVKPGTPRLEPSEYYPEAWRCKCRNKLYMP